MSRLEDDPFSLPDDPDLERLLRAAGQRPALPATELAASRERVLLALRARYGRPTSMRASPARGRRRPARWLLLAAASVLVVAGLLVARGVRRAAPSEPAAAEVVARVELIGGAVSVRIPAAAGLDEVRALAAGERVPAGTRLEVGAAGEGRLAGRLALRLAGGASLRADAGSELLLAAADRIELVRGRIYLDSDPSAGGRAPAVDMPHGRVVDVGTQYELALGAGGDARLRVREGRVELQSGRLLEAAAGEELAVANDGSATRAPFPAYGPEWGWVIESAPVPAIDGWSVARFLDWLARESGTRLDYADVETARRAAEVTVHGSVERLSPFAAAEVVLASAGCAFELDGERLRVRRASRPAS